MPQGGDTTAPDVQLLIDLDDIAIHAGALAAGYHGTDADPLEDRIAEWKGELLRRFARKYEPDWLVHIERADAIERLADQRCDVWVDGQRDAIHAAHTRAIGHASALIRRTQIPRNGGAALTGDAVAAALA